MEIRSYHDVNPYDRTVGAIALYDGFAERITAFLDYLRVSLGDPKTCKRCKGKFQIHEMGVKAVRWGNDQYWVVGTSSRCASCQEKHLDVFRDEDGDLPYKRPHYNVRLREGFSMLPDFGEVTNLDE